MGLMLVTGASAGLGLASVTALAEQGHDVVLHARSSERIRDHTVLARMYDVVYGDLSSLETTVRVAERANEIGVFDAVIHNAGVLRGPDVLAVNTIAPFVLTALMTPPRRSIYLSSSMHSSGSTELGDAAGFDVQGRRRPYEDSKLYVTTLAMTVAARRPDMLSHAVDPGWVPTRMGGAGATDSIAEGHFTQEWLSTADETEIVPRTRGYWYHRATRSPHPATRDLQFQSELLRRLEASTGLVLPA